MGRFFQATKERVKRNYGITKASRKAYRMKFTPGGVLRSGVRRIGRVLSFGKLGRYRK